MLLAARGFQCCCHLQQYHIYEAHARFGHLTASSALARLQLAALHAATSSLLPEPGSLATGAETALQLVRQSWSNKPLSSAELGQLRSISALGGHLLPALRLAVSNAEASARQLQHLYVHATAQGAAAAAMEALGSSSSSKQHADAASSSLHPDAAGEYQLQAQRVLPGGWRLSSHARLSALEELRLLHVAGGISSTAAAEPAWRRQKCFNPIRSDQMLPCPVADGWVAEAEQQLQALVVQRKPGATPAYPLQDAAAAGGVPLSAKLHAELQTSWEQYHQHPEPTAIVPGAEAAIIQLQVRACSACAVCCCCMHA